MFNSNLIDRHLQLAAELQTQPETPCWAWALSKALSGRGPRLGSQC